jgi:ubiquinone/menaquinone biosynthesis C-methylase UbiE
MNAEKLEFSDNSFDLVYGEAIIHHLDINIAMKEIKRVLKPEGFAVFLEPRGNNPLVNWYRNKTPHLRTVDEHPLVKNDFDIMKRYFSVYERNYFMLSLVSFVFRKFVKSETLYKISRIVLDFLDKLLFAVFPFLRKYAWYCIIKLSNKR